MNYVSCVIRLLDIPNVKFYQDNISLIHLPVEIGHLQNYQNNLIVEAIVWGDLVYTLIQYYQINDYLLIEGSLFEDSNKKLNYNKNLKLSIFQIYPLIF